MASLQGIAVNSAASAAAVAAMAAATSNQQVHLQKVLSADEEEKLKKLKSLDLKRRIEDRIKNRGKKAKTTTEAPELNAYQKELQKYQAHDLKDNAGLSRALVK